VEAPLLWYTLLLALYYLLCAVETFVPADGEAAVPPGVDVSAGTDARCVLLLEPGRFFAPVQSGPLF
jgi:hypothetical protein